MPFFSNMLILPNPNPVRGVISYRVPFHLWRMLHTGRARWNDVLVVW